jgi:tetratricopeptide (TPR) repeat protein
MTILTSPLRRSLAAAACILATPVAAQEVTISTTTESARRLFLDARDRFHMTRFAEARELLEETLEEEPGLALAHAYLALAESFTYHDPTSSLTAARDPAATANSGERLMADALASFLDHDLGGAVSTLLEVMSAFPDDPYVRHALGFTLVDFGVTHEGIEVLESLLADRPDFVAAWNHLGYAYLDLGDLQQALGCQRRFVALAPDNPSAHDSLADGLATTGRIDEAIASLTRAALLDPRYAYAYLHLGDILTIEDELQLARASYRRAIDMDSPNGPGFSIFAWHRIAQSWLHGLDFEAARATYRTIIDLCDKLDADDDALAAERMLLTTLLVEGEGSAAREVLQSLESRVDRLPGSERTARESWISFYRGWLGVVEHDTDAIDRMIDILEAEPTRDPDRRLAARLRGEAALADLRFEDAATAFEMAGTSDPVVLVRLAAAYDGLGRQATAGALFNEAASCDTFDFECALARGLAQPLSWSPPPISDPFDWETIPPGAEDSVPDTIARLGRIHDSRTRLTQPMVSSSLRP